MAKSKILNQFHFTLLLALAVLLAAGFLLKSISTSSATPGNFQPNKEVSKGNCDTTGAPVINVTQRVLNTVDSGEGGNNWAFDTVNKQIKVYKESENTFCVLVDNEGRFDSQAGQKSPGNTGVLTGKEDGSFKGGYRAQVVGSLKTNPELQTKGNIGTVDYQCTIEGTCPGYFNWVDKYFSPGYTFSYEWWGWEYKYKNLKWINASTGNSGDII